MHTNARAHTNVYIYLFVYKCSISTSIAIE